MRAPGSQQSTKTETKAGGAGPVDPFLPQTLPKRANKEQTLPAPGHTAPCARPPGSGSTSRAGGKRRPSALGCAPPSPTPRQRPTRKRCLLPSLASQLLHDTAMVLCPPPPPPSNAGGARGVPVVGATGERALLFSRAGPVLPSPHPSPPALSSGRRGVRSGRASLSSPWGPGALSQAECRSDRARAGSGSPGPHLRPAERGRSAEARSCPALPLPGGLLVFPPPTWKSVVVCSLP